MFPKLSYRFFVSVRQAACFLVLSGFASCSAHSAGSDHDDHDETSIHHSHEGAVVIDSRQALKFGITTQKVEPSAFAEVIRTSGRIEPAATDLYTITALKSGIITLNPGVGTGMAVSNGENIGYISSEGMQGGDINAAAASNLQAAKKEYERLLPLFRDGLVTASAFNEAERAYNEAKALAGKGSPSPTSPVVSQSSGTINSLFVSSGQYVEAGAPVAIVSKNSKLTLVADLPSRFSASLSGISSANIRIEGNETIIKLANYDGTRINSNGTSARNGYIPVYFSFTGDPSTAAGSYAEVFLIGNQRQGVISVPRSALIEMQGNRYIYVVEDGHAYEKRLVTTGATDGNLVEITGGLVEGETVVTSGASAVRMAETSAIAPPSHSHNH